MGLGVGLDQEALFHLEALVEKLVLLIDYVLC